MFRFLMLLPLFARLMLLNEGGEGGDGGSGGEGGESGGGEGAAAAGTGSESAGSGDKGFPADTPVAEMTADQQAAYWKHQARKHEGRVKAMGDYDDLKTAAQRLAEIEEANATEQEKAVKAARTEGEAAAMQKVGARLVDAEIRAVSAGRLTDDQRAVLLDGLDRSRFLTEDGDVDTDKVTSFIDGIAPAKGDPEPRRLDLGQGRRKGGVKPSVSAGRDLYEQRHGKSA